MGSVLSAAREASVGSEAGNVVGRLAGPGGLGPHPRSAHAAPGSQRCEEAEPHLLLRGLQDPVTEMQGPPATGCRGTLRMDGRQGSSLHPSL